MALQVGAMTIESATAADTQSIVSIFIANKGDPGLFQESKGASSLNSFSNRFNIGFLCSSVGTLSWSAICGRRKAPDDENKSLASRVVGHPAQVAQPRIPNHWAPRLYSRDHDVR